MCQIAGIHFKLKTGDIGKISTRRAKTSIFSISGRTTANIDFEYLFKGMDITNGGRVYKLNNTF
jgi:hypothetical protein